MKSRHANDNITHTMTLGGFQNLISELRPKSITVLPREDSLESPLKIDMRFSSIHVFMSPNTIIISNDIGYIRVDNVTSIYVYNKNCLGTMVAIVYTPNILLPDIIYKLNIILDN